MKSLFILAVLLTGCASNSRLSGLPPMPPQTAAATGKPALPRQAGGPAAPPVALKVAAPAPSYAVLNWSYPSNSAAAGFNLYTGTNSGTYTSKINARGAAVRSYSINSLIPGTTYYFSATACDSNGLESPYSAEIVYTAPMPPTNVLLTITTLTSSNLAGPWTPFTGMPPIVVTNPTLPFTFWRLSITAARP